MSIRQEIDSAGRLFALHVDHQLRGEASKEDSDWFSDTCHALGVESMVLTPARPPNDSDLSDGVEAYARQTRYKLLADACESLGARYLATAHNANDQAETVLLRILRGTGLRGAAGIPFTRPITPSLSVVRPLLGCSRDAVLQYLSELGQEFREDETNGDLTYRRNLIRHELLPGLESAFPDTTDALRRLADQCREAQELIEDLADRVLADCDVQLADECRLSLLARPLAEASESLAREALRIAWRSAGLGEQSMSSRWWRQLTQLARERGGETLTLPGDVRAGIEADRLVFRTAKASSAAKGRTTP